LFSNNDVCIIDLRGNEVSGAANFDELVVCGKTDTLALQIDAEISLSGATFEATLPDGISYVGGAYTGNNQNLPTASGSSGNNPIFNLPSVPAGGSIIVNIPIKADCGIIPAWEGFQPIEFNYSVNAGGQVFDFTPILAYNNEIYVPSLNVLNVFPSYPSINIGDTFIREITISQDGINAFLTGFQFTHDYEPGVQYNSLSIGVSGGSPTNLSFTDDGSQVTYQITTADLSAIGLNGIFDESQTVVLYEEVTVVACEGNSSLVNYDVSWGCDGELCESLVFVNGFSLNSGQPDVEFTVTGSEADDFCATNFVEMTVANQGTEPVPNSGYAKDLTLKLDPQCGALEFSKNFDIISISVNGSNVAVPSPNGVGDYPISLAGVLTDMDGDGSSDDLGLNASFTVYVEYERKCQSLGCQEEAAPCDGFQIVADYKDQCNLIRAPELHQVFGTEYGSFQSQFVESGHVINGSPEEFKATFCYSFANADLTCPGAEVNLMFSTSNTDVTPLAATIDDGSGISTSNFTSLGNGEYSFSGGSTGDGLIEECWELDLKYEGPCSSAGPVIFTFDVVYSCPCSGCEITRACETYQSFIKNFCPGYGDDCLGIDIDLYEINRTTMGWTDETMTTLVDANAPGLVLDRAYVCDNINANFGGVVSGPSGTVNQLDMIMEIVTPAGDVPLEFLDATLYVNGQPYCAGAVPDPTVASTNGNVTDWVFDLDGCLSSNNLVINIGDEVYLDANFTIIDADGLTNYWELVQFRSEFRVNGESVGCYDECFDFYVQKPDVQAYANTLVQVGCDAVMHLEGSLGINSYTGDDFPNEYRPWIGNIQEIILDAPFGLAYIQGSAMMNVFDGTNTTSIPITPYQALGEHIYYFDDFTGLVVPDKTEGGIQISFSADFVGSCKVNSSEFKFSYIFDKYYYAINDNPGCIETVDGSVSNTVEFVKPAYHMAAVNPIQEATEQQVTWDVQVCGIFEGATASFSWMGFETQSNAMTLVALEDITDPSNPISYSINPYGQNNGWAETGTFMDRDCRMFRITAEYSTCEIDKAIVRFNWNCADDFTGPDNFLYGCEPSEEIVELSLYPQESAIQANLTDLSDTIALCEDGFFEIEFKNVKKGNVYDIVFQIIVPFNGVDFVPNSFEIAYPISAAYTPIGFNPTVVDTLQYGFVYQYDMDNVDPIFLDGLPAIPTPTDVENRFKIRFEVESFCGFVSGGVFRFITYGHDACGQQTPGTFQNEEIIIDGAAPQYSLVTGIQTNTAAPCNGGTTFTVQVLNQGPEITSDNDQIEIVLPAGMSYQPNSSTAIWAIGEPTVVTQFGFDFVTWDLPNNIDINETIEFAFTGNEDGSLTCAPIQFTATTLSGVDLVCADSGESCNVPIQTGGQIIDLEIVKPDLAVINASLSSTCGEGGELVSATATVENIGAPASAGGSVTIDFVYDANGDGVFDSGDEVIYSHSENIAIPTNGTGQVSAEFTTPAGKACPLLLVLNNQNNCICNTTAYAVSAYHYANAGPDQEACAGSGEDQQVQLGCDPVAGYSYSWSPSTGFSCVDCANPMVTLTNDTNAPTTASYVLTTTRGNCESSDTVVVTILPTTQSSDPAVNICDGDELQLSGPNGGSNYSWTPVAGVADPSSQNTTVTPPNGNTVYTLSYETGTGCPSVHTIEVNVTENPTPVITVEGNNSFCDNETIDVTLDAGAGYDVYTWYQEGNTNFTANTQTINVTTEGTYYVIVQNGNCESAPSNSIAITTLGFSGPVISLNGPDTICDGESTELQITGDYTTINWYVANANGNPSGASLGTGNNITISDAGMYVAEVVDENGCEGTSNVVGVMVNSISDIDIIEGDQTICEGETVTLSILVGFVPYTDITWYLDGVEINENEGLYSIQVSEAGEYTVEVDGDLICPSTSEPVTVSISADPTATITVVGNQALCDGESTNLVISGDYDSYQWYDDSGAINGAIDNNLSVTSAGTYYAVVTVGGCTGQTDPIEITVNSNPTVDIYVENNDIDLCIGETTVITTDGSYATYQWYNDLGQMQGENGQNLTVNASGTYYLIVTTDSGCTAQSDPITITVHPDPVVTVTSSDQTICEGQVTTLTATTGFASYEWYKGNSLAGSSEAIVVLVTGDYYVVVTDEYGCQGQSDPIMITVNSNPGAVITIAGSGSLCDGESTNLVISGDFDSYQWYDENGVINGATENILTVNTAGSYYAEVTVNSCVSQTAPAEITVSGNPTVDIYVENNDIDLCIGETAVVTTDGSYASYQWYDDAGAIPGGIGQDLIVNASGNYYLVVTTTSGCNAQSDPVTITVHPNPVVSVTSTNPAICQGQSTTVSATTGFASYEWYEGNTLVGTSETIIILETGDYYVVVTDQYGCRGQSAPITVTADPRPDAEITIVQGGSCFGDVIELAASAGGANYEWFVNGTSVQSGASANFEMQSEGTVYVVVTSSTGCESTSAELDFVYNSLPEPQIIAEAMEVCLGGSIDLLADVTGVTYTWTSSDVNTLSCTDCQSPVATPTTTTTYTLAVVNPEGCSGSTSITIEVYTNPTVSISINDNEICSGEQAVLTATAGFDNYTWTNQAGSVVQNGISNEYTTLVGGTFTVVATNASGCAGTSDPQTLTVLNNPSVTVSGEGAFCPGENITVQATSGFATYQWFEYGQAVGGNSDTYSTNNESAIYVIVTDANGCTGTSNTVNVFEAPSPDPSITSSNGLNLCSGQSTVLNAATNGALYTWTSSNEGSLSCLNCQNPTVNPISTTTYTLTITNGSGCSSTSTVTVNISELPTVSLATNDGEICAGETALLTATAGFQNYVWHNQSGAVIQEGPDNTFTANLGGVYYVVASNGAGCFDTSNSINIIVNPTPVVGLTVAGNGTFCEDQEITIQATPGYASYVWTQNGQVAGENTASFTAQIAADIYVTITDANGCTATSETVSVSPAALPMPVINLVGGATICQGTSTNLAVVGTYSDIVWRKDGVLIPNANGNSISVTESGNYTVTVNDSQSCVGTSEPITITVLDLPEVSLPNGPYGLCGDETATITAPAGFANYAWYNNGTVVQDGSNNAFAASENGSFYIVVTDDNGCSATSNTVIVELFEVLNANIVSNDDDNTICLGDCIQLFLNTDAANYSWTPEDGSLTCTNCPNPIVCPTGTTTYTVTMTSDDGCVSQASITINTVEGEDPALQLLTANGVCEGETVGISATPGFDIYTWYNEQGVIVQSSTANEFYTEEEGNYFMQATGNNGCLAGSDTLGIFFATAPETPVLSLGEGNNFCEDGAIALSATSGDMSFEWTIQGSSATSDPQGASLNYDPINYAVSVTVTNDSGCSAESAPITLNVNEAPMPMISHGSLNVCAGECVPLSVLGNYSIIEWYLNGILIENAISNNYCATESGVYSVFVNGENGCSGLSEGVEVDINDPIIVNVDSDGGVFCQSGAGEVVLTGPPGYDSYNWYLNSVALIQTSMSPSYTVTQDGYYVLVVVDSLSCEGASDPIEITLVEGPVILISSSQTSVCPGESVGLFASCPSDNVSWSDGGDNSTLSCTDCLDPIATPTETTTYTITVTDENGCESVKSITIYVEELPALNIEALSATSFCTGGSVLLLASEGFNHYYWLNEEGIVVQQGTTNSFNATESGAYTVYAETASDCVAYSSDLITVSVTAAPYVTIISNATFCEGGDATITATAGYASYEWFVNGASQGASTANELMITDDGTVSVIVTNADGCTAQSNELNISISASVAPEIYIVDGDSLICDGEYVQLMVNGMYAQYKWFLNGVLIPNSNATSIEVNEAGTYHIYVNSNDGCEGFSQELFIGSHPNPTLEITPNEFAFCAITGVTDLTATPGFSTYYWYRNGLLLEISENNVLETELGGTYTVEAVTENGCQVIGETPSTVTVYPNSPLNIIGSDLFICPGDIVDLSVNSTGVSYAWDASEPGTFINCSSCVAPSVQPTVTTTYTVSMEDVNGCYSAGAIIITVADDEMPVIEGESNILCGNSLLNLSIQSNYNSYQWYFNGVPVYEANTSVLTINAAGNYYVEVMSSNNCPLVSEPFIIYDSQLETPTVTIDGDTDFCVGDGDVTLVAGLQSNGTAYDNHAWFANGSDVAFENASSITVSESGSYVLMVEDENGCQAYSEPVIINISESTNVSVFTNQTDICEGESTTLYIGEEEEGLVVFWFEEGNSNVPLNTESAVSIAVGASGNYYAEVFNAAGCTGISNTVAINVIDNPVISIIPGGPVEICEGGTATLSTQGGFLSYSWYANGEMIANANSSTYETSMSGSYSVSVTNGSGCQATSNSVEVIQGVYAGEVDFSLPSQSCMGTATILSYEGTLNIDDITWDLGSASLTVTDGVYTLVWSAAGLYTVTASTTSGGCYYEQEQTIQVNAPEVSYTEDIHCATSCTSEDGAINLQFGQNPDNLNIAWTGPNGFTSSDQNISNLVDGDYQVTITDANGCSVSDVYTVCIQTQTIEANDDFANTAEDTPVEICILSNDTGNVIDFNIIETQPANGSIAENANGCMVYTPNAGYFGSDQFTYSIQGDCGDVSIATVFITVEQATCNELTAENDNYTTNSNTPIELCILSNDSGDSFTLNAISTDVQFGSLALAANGCYTYTPDNDFVGTDYFVYSIIDECGNIDIATATITVAQECADIVANNDVLEAVTNIPGTVCVLVNDSGTDINISGIAVDAQNGTVTASGDGCYTYQSIVDFVGTDSFVYSITDQCGNTTTATVQINVAGPVGLPNEPPFENTFEACVEPITPTNLCYEFLDPNNDNTYISEYTSLFDCSIEIIDDNCIQYTALPALEYDTITLTICDDGDPVRCSETTINITVGGCTPCESTLIANNDQATIDMNTSYSTCVLDNDSGSGISVSGIATQPQNGILDVLPSGCIVYTPDDFYVGGDSYVYTVVDDCGSSAQATVNINIIDDSNDPPNVEVVEYCVNPITPTIICHEFTDPNGDGTMIAETNSLFDCSITILNDSCLRYTSLPGIIGTDTVTLTICDDHNPSECSISQLVIHVGCEAPIANNDVLMLNCDGAIFNGQALAGQTFDLAANDSDNYYCSDMVEVTIETSPSGGVLSGVGNNSSYTYTPNDGFFGTEVINYTMCNACGMCSTASLTIEVENCVPDTECNPVSAICTQEITPTPICVEFCNLSMNNNPEFYLINSLYNCSLSLTEFPCIVYTAVPGFIGNELLELIACDDLGICDTAYVNVTVGECTELEAIDDVYTIAHNEATALDIMANDHGSNFTLDDYTQTVNGTLTAGNGGLIYTPNDGYVGEDNFTYTICDAAGNCDDGIVYISVSAACNNVFDECTAPFTSVSICPDFCGDVTGFTITDVTNNLASNIEVTEALCFDYTPQIEAGLDTIVATACAPNNVDCATVYIVMDIVCSEPIAVDDYGVMLQEYGSISIDVLFNDEDACRNQLTIAAVGDAPNGTVFQVSDGSLVYEPNPEFEGEDSFEYTVCNGCGNCDVGIVYINVQADGAFALAVDDNVQTQQNKSVQVDVLSNDVNLNFSVNIENWTHPREGSVLLMNEQEFVYKPNLNYAGIDSFDYEICVDGLCDQARVFVEVLEDGTTEILAPGAEDDFANTNEGQAVIVDLTSNDANIGENPYISITANVADAGISISSDGTITVTPVSAFIGTITFDYEICNDSGLCDVATVTVEVRPAGTVEDAPPIAEDDEATILSGETINIAVLANDSDPLGGLLEVTIISGTENGTVNVNGDNTVSYIPNPSFIGTDIFQYEICNEAGLCASATVTVTVEDCELRIPNAFSPNGDSKNDLFEVVGLECFDSAEIQIFNRWGNQVYESDRYDDATNWWNGRTDNAGSELPEGVYFFVLKIANRAQDPIINKGYVNIKR